MNDLRFSCSTCGQHIVCDIAFIGRETDCPTCLGNMTIPMALKAELLPIKSESNASVPGLIYAFGVVVVGLTILQLLVKGYYLLQLLAAAPLAALIAGVPSVTLSVLLIRLGSGLQRGERLAVWGFLTVAALETLTWWMAIDYLFSHPLVLTVKLALVLIPAAFCSVLAVNASCNWERLK